jgi:hypothetical protein
LRTPLFEKKSFIAEDPIFIIVSLLHPAAAPNWHFPRTSAGVEMKNRGSSSNKMLQKSHKHIQLAHYLHTMLHNPLKQALINLKTF